MFQRSLLCLSLSQSLEQASVASLQCAGQKCVFFVLRQHNCNDPACRLSTPAMGVQLSWASSSAARMPVPAILELRYECRSAKASRGIWLLPACSSLPSGCRAPLSQPYGDGGLPTEAGAWSPATTTSLVFSCPCLHAAVTRAELWAGFEHLVLRSF